MRGVKIVSRTETTKIIVDDETRPIPIILFILFTIAATTISIMGIIRHGTPFANFAFCFAISFSLSVLLYLLASLQL